MELFIFTNLLIILPCAFFWFVLSRINWKIWDNFKENERAWGLYAKSGLIGVPIHEISHIIFHIIFGHNIVNVDLYNPDGFYDEDEDTLGHVDFEYNTGSLYQCFGLFFAGIAPLVVGSIIIVLLLRFVMPETFNALIQVNITDINFFSIIKDLLYTIFENTKIIFSNRDSFWQLLIFFVAAFSISTQMHCSKPDLKNAYPGFILVETLILAVSIFMFIYKVSLKITFFVNIAAYIITIIFLELLLSSIFLVISFALKN